MANVRRVRWTQDEPNQDTIDSGFPDEALNGEGSKADALPIEQQQQQQPQRQQQHPWPYNFDSTIPPPAETPPDYDDDDDDEEELTDNDGDDSQHELDDYDDDDYDDDEDAMALYRSEAQAPPEIMHERLEWQQMLQSVLMGEVLKSEKKRLSSSDRLKQQKPIQEIWLSLRALLRGRTIAQEQKYLDEGRRDVEAVIERVEQFKVHGDGEETALDQVANVLKDVDKIESLYSTRAEMIHANPHYGAPEFQARLDALNAWCTITRSLHMQYKILRNWTGSEDLQIARKQDLVEEPAVSSYLQVQKDPSFVERILKESALQDTFDKRTLSALNSLLVKSKMTMIANNGLFDQMNLPPFINQLRHLAVFPTSLVEEALKLRLEYKDRLQEPPKQMVDAMMEDYRGLLSLACRVKHQYEELAHPAPGWQLKSDEFIDRDYDAVLMESMRFYFKLITWKLDLERENSLRECEVMEKEWDFLKATVCQSVDRADEECASQFW